MNIGKRILINTIAGQDAKITEAIVAVVTIPIVLGCTGAGGLWILCDSTSVDFFRCLRTGG